MKIIKVVNNNIVISNDDKGTEMVLMGRGLGFQKHPGDEIDDQNIEKKFAMKNEKISHRFQELAADIPIERLEITDKIIQYAKDFLQKEINDNIYISLTDHINFAIERVSMGLPFQNPFLWEIKKFYFQEYLVGQAALGMIERSLKVTLPQDEAAFIALHIVNAELDLDMSSMMSMTKMVDDILKIVDDSFPKVNKESVYYERFITHLKFFAQRIFAGKEVTTMDEEFQYVIRNKYQDCQSCVQQICDYIKNECGHQSTDEEKLYLTVHIKRVISVPED